MAQVTMDSSEWELMRENKTLLEKSLHREKELSSEVDRLNKEKIKVLEESSKKITIVRKSLHEEHVMTAKNADLNLSQFMDLVTSSKQYWHIGDGKANPFIIDFSHLMAKLFTKTKVVCEENVSYDIVGLDDAKSEIEKKLRSDLDAEIKKKLERLIRLEDDNKSFVLNLKKADSQIQQLNNYISLVEATNKVLNNMLALNLEEKFCRANIIQELKRRNFFNSWSILDKIESLVFTENKNK